MKYQVLKGCVINKKAMNAGEVIDVSGDDEKTLLSMGRITPYSEPLIENRSVGLEDSPEKPKRRKKNAS
tara:strand:- start:342 stop:548 length:207 start_codon:yes stop_codon:yes gene_type:complete